VELQARQPQLTDFGELEELKTSCNGWIVAAYPTSVVDVRILVTADTVEGLEEVHAVDLMFMIMIIHASSPRCFGAAIHRESLPTHEIDDQSPIWKSRTQ